MPDRVKVIEHLLNHLNFLVAVYWAARTGESEIGEKKFLRETKELFIKSLYPQYILGLACLFDPAEDWKKNKNFSLHWIDPKFAREIEVGDISVVSKIKDIRRKLLAHRDRELFLNAEASLSEISLSKEDSWRLLEKIINRAAFLAQECRIGNKDDIENKLRVRKPELIREQTSKLFSLSE